MSQTEINCFSSNRVCTTGQLEVIAVTQPNGQYYQYKGSNYTSASINMQGKASFTCGRIKMRAKVSKGYGSCPAFWMLGVGHGEGKWPDCGEIDTMEFVGKDSPSVYGTMRYTDNLGKYEHQGMKPVVGAPYEGFHVYAVERKKNRISFYYDSIRYFAVNLPKVDSRARKILGGPFYLLVNLALGRTGTQGGKLDESILLIKYYVDYVRVYK